jgi:hypothetical protein
MGNIINGTSKQIFGLDKLLCKPEKKMIVPKKSVYRKGDYMLLLRDCKIYLHSI